MASWDTKKEPASCKWCSELQENKWEMVQIKEGGLVCEPCYSDYELKLEDSNYTRHDDRIDFADPGGRSSLRAETDSNPRNRSCPNCQRENQLTPLDVSQGYQCNRCADRAEGHYDY